MLPGTFVIESSLVWLRPNFQRTLNLNLNFMKPVYRMPHRPATTALPKLRMINTAITAKLHYPGPKKYKNHNICQQRLSQSKVASSIMPHLIELTSFNLIGIWFGAGQSHLSQLSSASVAFLSISSSCRAYPGGTMLFRSQWLAVDNSMQDRMNIVGVL